MKALFFDIDGTLQSEKTGTIPESAKRAIAQAQANGHLAFVNTGRPRASLEPAILNLGLDGYICGCGTYIEYRGQILLNSVLPLKTQQKIVACLKRDHISAILEGTQAVYYAADERHPTVLDIRQHYAEVGFDTTKTWDDADLSFAKLTCWLNDDSDFNRFVKDMAHLLVPIKRGENFYEWIQPAYSKATGIHTILKRFNLSMEDAFAFGDSTNDLSMLQAVKYSVAMKESHSEVRQQAYWVTRDVDEDGIALALEHFGLCKRSMS